jgi:hypothetical protein
MGMSGREGHEVSGGCGGVERAEKLQLPLSGIISLGST